ncbi:hypothetical protein BCR39DRAFT_379626 [Naematelia encephala]|uniref:Protein CPL1-like domain-containing protein n=1 Tax=Naematelia encephala TaxID=71784 RepID=A0A1Y2BCP6_9TREE|nr:hypothetical protein BCR39DRAFT_379626 [Naematelia encephala]
MYTLTATLVTLAILSLVSAQTFAPAYEGCILAADVPSGDSTGAQSSGSTCASSCSTTYAYFLTSGSDCICTDTAPVATWYTTSASSAGGCASTSDYQVYKVSSTFVFQACLSNFHDDLGLKHDNEGSQTSFEACLAYCDISGAAFVAPLTNGEWDCWCETSYTPLAYNTCGPSDPQVGNYFAYTHDLPSASGLTRRRQRRSVQEQLRLSRLEALRRPCPGEMEACLIPGSDSFECIDPKTELESCGGCQTGYWDKTRIDALGTDCTLIPGVLSDAVTCLNASCHAYRCEPGWRLVDGDCIPL